MAFHVLLVEPDAALADEIRRAFGPLGFSVTSVQAGEPALARCKESPPDLILLAAELPDMSGFSVCNRLKRALSSVPLVLYTAEATEAAIEAHRATRNRADDYVRKPFELADLLARAAALLQTDQPGPPPPPVTPPAAPRPDGHRPEDAPPVLSRVDSGQVAARGLAAAMQAASAPPTPPAIRAPSRPGVPAVSAPATPPGLPTSATAAPAGPPPVPGQRAPAAIGRVKVPALSRDAFAVLEEWPRDPAPPKGTPEEKLEYFRERLRVRDAFLAKIRDAIGEAKGVHAQLAGERDLLQRDLDLERDRALGLEGRAQEAAQDAAAQAARIDDLRRQLEESETTRQSLSDVLSETMQQHEAAEQQWSTRIAESDSDRARLEAEIADQAEAHARAVAALEADRADERARAEATRAEAEEAYARAAAATNEEREKERAEATGRQHLAEERVTALGVERDRLQAELVRVAEEQRARLAVLAEEEAARAQAAAEELGAVRARLDEATGRGEALEAELAEARARIAARGARSSEARAALEDELRQARAEAKAYDEKAIAAEHAHQAKVAELAEAEQRIRELGTSAEGTLGELAQVEAARADAARRAAQLQADRDQLGREVEGARRETEAAREETRLERERTEQLSAEVARLGLLEPVAEEASRLRKDVATLKELVQQRTAAAESGARAAQAAAAERARAEERLSVEGARLQAQVGRLEEELAAAARRVEELNRDGAAREAALRKAGQDAEERRKAVAASAAQAEQRHGAEIARLKGAMVELERHLESRARAELQMKKRLQELERAASGRAAPAAADPAEVQKLKASVAKLTEEIGDLRGENDFLNGEVARYVQKNKDLVAQIASLRES